MFETEALRDDPISELLADLERSGKPRLPWVTRWAPDGESIAAAWRASRDAAAMARLLQRVGRVPAYVLDALAADELMREERACAAFLASESASARAQRDWRNAREFQTAADVHEQNAKVALLQLPARWQAALAALRAEPPPTLTELLAPNPTRAPAHSYP